MNDETCPWMCSTSDQKSSTLHLDYCARHYNTGLSFIMVYSAHVSLMLILSRANPISPWTSSRDTFLSIATLHLIFSSEPYMF